MILPNPIEIKLTESRPMTWTLLALNVLLFQMFFFSYTVTGIKDKGVSTETIHTAARVYQDYFDSLSKAEQAKEPVWISKISTFNSDHLDLVGTYALRNRKFVDYFYQFTAARGNIIEIKNARIEMQALEKKMASENIYRFGLSSSNQQWVQWIAYQFSHAGYLHLMSNMIFLVFIGLAVESLVGSAGLLFLYLSGGLAGGFLFLHMNPSSLIPMVGASAAISCLISFFAVAEKSPRIRYFYFLFPSPGMMGYIYLPTLLLIPMFIISDFASLMGTPDGMGSGIAFSAHVGGAIMGIFLGLVSRYAPRSSTAKSISAK